FDLVGMAGNRKAQAHPGAALAGPKVRGILQFDSPAMILENPADDRKPESGALLASGDIGFKEPRTRDLGQADTVVEHVDHDVVVLGRGDDVDTAFAELL